MDLSPDGQALKDGCMGSMFVEALRHGGCPNTVSDRPCFRLRTLMVFRCSKGWLLACDDEMTSLRLDDGGCAAMTPAACEAFGASRTSFRHYAAQRRSHSVIRHKKRLQRETESGRCLRHRHRSAATGPLPLAGGQGQGRFKPPRRAGEGVVEHQRAGQQLQRPLGIVRRARAAQHRGIKAVAQDRQLRYSN